MNKLFLLLGSFLIFTFSCQKEVLDSEGKTHLVLQSTTKLQTDNYTPPSYQLSNPWHPFCLGDSFCFVDPQPLVYSFGSKPVSSSLAFPNGTVWLITSDGKILKKTGDLWSLVTDYWPLSFSDVVGSDPNEVWIASDTGVVHCQNGICRKTELTQAGTLNNHLVQTEDQDLWFFTKDFEGKVYHRSPTDTQFVLMDSLILDKLAMDQRPYQVIGVWGKSKTDVTLVLASAHSGANGDGSVLALTWDGTQFSTPTVVLPNQSLLFASLINTSKQEVWLWGYIPNSMNDRKIYHSSDGTTWTEITGDDANVWLRMKKFHFYENTLWGLTTDGSGFYKYNGTTWDKVMDHLPLTGISDFLGEFWVWQNQLWFFDNTDINAFTLYQSQPNFALPFTKLGTVLRSGDAIQNRWSLSKEESFTLLESADKQHLVHQHGQAESFTLPEEVSVGFATKTSDEPSTFWFGGKNVMYSLQDHVVTKWVLPPDWEVSDTSFEISSIWGPDSKDVWAISYQGHVFHFDGNLWSLVATSEDPLRTIWGNNEKEVWIGGSGILLHYDGTQFESIPLPADNFNIKWIWDDDSMNKNFTNIWFADSQVLINHYLSYQYFRPVPAQPISSVFQLASGETWLIAGNKVFQKDKTDWKMVLDLSTLFSGIKDWQLSGSDANDLWLFSPGYGYVLRKQN